MKDEQRARRRCTSCRRWYLPAASAVHNQKTCGAVECRRRRRNRTARRRRQRDIQDFRVEERVRQRRHRENRRRDENRGLSRAGLAPQVIDIERVLLEKWDRQIDMSRAGLRREIRMALGRAARIVGQESAST
jgi:hypothetical protein